MAYALGITPTPNITRPPRVGPFARHGWDEAGACWRVSLTTAGQTFVTKFLEQFPVPLMVLAVRSPVLFRRLQRESAIGTESDAHAEALNGLCYAAQTFDDSGRCDFATHAGWKIYSAVGNARRMARLREVRMPMRVLSPYRAYAAGGEPDATAEADDERAKIGRDAAGVLARLPRDVASVLAYRFGLRGESVLDAGERARRNRCPYSTQTCREHAAIVAAREILGVAS